MPFAQKEMLDLERYLRKKFSNPAIKLKPQKGDALEVLLGEEFIGTMYKDEEDEDTSYTFTMAILDIDLEE